MNLYTRRALMMAACSSTLAVCLTSRLFAPPRPNTILPMADDQGWAGVAYNADPDMGLLNRNLDRMAEAGICFGLPASAPDRRQPGRGTRSSRSPESTSVSSPLTPK